MKQFRLLRSNKESGPYSADELIRMGLKAYDLIWVDGKSAAWRYPSEIDELKAYAPAVEEQPFDRFYKRPVTAAIKKEENKPASPVHSVTTVTIKEKPRIRVSATWNRIEPVVIAEKKQPQSVQKPVADQINTSQLPSWQDSWLDWEKEKKAVSSTSRFSGTATPPVSENKPPALQTKFSQSLDEIKERYAETVLRTRSNSLNISQYKNFALTAFLIVTVSGLGYALWHEWNSKDETANVLLTTPKPGEDKKNIQLAEQAGTDISDKQEQANAKTYIVPVQEKNSSTNLVQSSKKEIIKNRPAPSVISKQKEAQSNNAKNKNKTPAGGNRSLVKQPNTYTAANTSVQQTTSSNIKSASETGSKISPIFNAISKSERVQDFVAVDAYNPSSSNSVENLSFNVQNVSDIPLDLVVMDLQYFGTDGKYRKGETVYMKNIAAGKTITVKAPDDKFSGKVTYKVSLVSAPQKDVYLIGD